MLQITTKEFNDKFKTNPNVEVLTKSFFDAWIEDNREVLVKAEKGEELTDLEKSEVNDLKENIRSFAMLEVYGREPHQQDIQKSIYYVREKQIEWDSEEFEKSEGGEILKARSGIYKDTALNRKMGRVGQRFGKHSSMDEDKKESDVAIHEDSKKLAKQAGMSEEEFKKLHPDTKKELLKQSSTTEGKDKGKSDKIRSIGVLNNSDGSYTLTPVLEGNSMPNRIKISKEEYETVKGDKSKMINLASNKLNKTS